MTFRIQERPGGICVVAIIGRFTVEHAPGTLVDAIEPSLRNRPSQVIVDLAEAPYVDSCGLGELVAAYLTAQRAGCRLSVVNANPRVMEVLRVTRLATVLMDPLASVDVA
jgi:anti-anti-sigma factor